MGISTTDKGLEITLIDTNCCGFKEPVEGDILVLGQFIKKSKKSKKKDKPVDLDKIQPIAPSKYYEYDGTLTTGDFLPVRWIIDNSIISLNIDEIIPIAKDSHPIQSLNGRIILFNTNKLNEHDKIV